MGLGRILNAYLVLVPVQTAFIKIGRAVRPLIEAVPLVIGVVEDSTKKKSALHRRTPFAQIALHVQLVNTFRVHVVLPATKITNVLLVRIVLPALLSKLPRAKAHGIDNVKLVVLVLVQLDIMKVLRVP